MKISIKVPVMERVDKVGAIFMASNITTTSHTKNMDIRHKYVNENVEDDVFKIIFVKFTDNDSDVLNKKKGADLHEKHSKKMVGEYFV